MRNRHGDFIWYELMTRDAQAAFRFYGPVAGWTLGERMPGDVDYRMIETGTGQVGGVLTLTDEMCKHGAKPTWLGYIGVDDVDATVARVQEKGGNVLMPAHDIPEVGRIAMLADPQGIPFYVIRGAVEDVSKAFSPDEPGYAAWNELNTTDLDAAKTFYPEVFGWTLGDAMPMGEMGDYQFIEHGGGMIGAMMKAQPGGHPSWNFCFRTSSVDRGLEEINNGGGSVTYGPAEVPGGDRVVQALDPEGAAFMIVSK